VPSKAGSAWPRRGLRAHRHPQRRNEILRGREVVEHGLCGGEARLEPGLLFLAIRGRLIHRVSEKNVDEKVRALREHHEAKGEAHDDGAAATGLTSSSRASRAGSKSTR